MFNDNSDIPAGNTNAITFNAPNFVHSNPRFWFLQMEYLFDIHRITTQTSMFKYVCAYLPPDIGKEVMDIVAKPPTERPYDALKSAVLARFAASDETRLKQLLSQVELGDRTPSQLLRHMRSLVGTMPIEDSLLLKLWSNCLPPNTKAILSLQPAGTSLDTLAEMADKVHECYLTPRLRSVLPTQSTVTTNGTDYQDDVRTLLYSIASRLDALTVTPRGSKPRSRSTSRRRRWCWYHQKFGPRARRCAPPCSFVKRESSSNSRASQ